MELMRKTSDHYNRVRWFMQLAHQETPHQIKIPDEQTRLLRAQLIWEEAIETINALGFHVRGELACYFEPREQGCDIIEVADGCADISVVNVGTLIAFGIPDIKLLEEVDKNNLSKFGPGSYKDEKGKWIKPPGWQGPEIEAILRGYGYTPE